MDYIDGKTNERKSHIKLTVITVLIFIAILGVIVFFATHDKDLGTSTDLTVTATEPGIYTDEESGIVYEYTLDPDNSSHGIIRIIEDPNHVFSSIAKNAK